MYNQAYLFKGSFQMKLAYMIFYEYCGETKYWLQRTESINTLINSVLIDLNILLGSQSRFLPLLMGYFWHYSYYMN